jgi:hypothetical protein
VLGRPVGAGKREMLLAAKKASPLARDMIKCSPMIIDKANINGSLQNKLVYNSCRQFSAARQQEQ